MLRNNRFVFFSQHQPPEYAPLEAVLIDVNEDVFYDAPEPESPSSATPATAKVNLALIAELDACIKLLKACLPTIASNYSHIKSTLKRDVALSHTRYSIPGLVGALASTSILTKGLNYAKSLKLDFLNNITAFVANKTAMLTAQLSSACPPSKSLILCQRLTTRFATQSHWWMQPMLNESSPVPEPPVYVLGGGSGCCPISYGDDSFFQSAYITLAFPTFTGLSFCPLAKNPHYKKTIYMDCYADTFNLCNLDQYIIYDLNSYTNTSVFHDIFKQQQTISIALADANREQSSIMVDILPITGIIAALAGATFSSIYVYKVVQSYKQHKLDLQKIDDLDQCIPPESLNRIINIASLFNINLKDIKVGELIKQLEAKKHEAEIRRYVRHYCVFAIDQTFKSTLGRDLGTATQDVTKVIIRHSDIDSTKQAPRANI